MTDETRLMLIILSIDPDASLKLSTYTGKWFVSSLISVADGTFLEGIAEHHPTPLLAIRVFYDRITSLPFDHAVCVTYPYKDYERRYFRWNGAAFTETVRPDAR